MMRDYLSVAKLFFVVGVIVSVVWLGLLMVTLGGVPVLLMRLSFPGLFIHWPGLPTEGVTGGMILVMFVVTSATNGVIYALIAVGISCLLKCFSSTTHNSH
jgi:hypothetical protein